MADYMSRHPIHLDTRNISEEYVNFLTLESLPRAIELDDEVRVASMTDKTIQMANPVRIRVRIDPPHPLVCRKRRLNGAVLRMRPEKPRPRFTAGVAR
jgi:hypothetical protein